MKIKSVERRTDMSKKKSYMICIEETSYGNIEVEAESPQEAEELAEEQYMNGNVYWGNCEYNIISVEEA